MNSFLRNDDQKEKKKKNKKRGTRGNAAFMMIRGAINEWTYLFFSVTGKIKFSFIMLNGAPPQLFEVAYEHWFRLT